MTTAIDIGKTIEPTPRTTRRRRRLLNSVAYALLAGTLSLGACSGGDGGTGPGDDGGGDGSTMVAPSNVQAVPVSSDEVLVTWDDNSQGESGFEVQRTPLGTGAWVSVTATGENENSFEDSGLQPLTGYEYRVRTVGDLAFSEFSPPANAVTFQPPEASIEAVESIAEAFLPPPGTPAEGRDLVAELEALAPALLSVPEVITVLVDHGTSTLQAVLRDGSFFLIPNNRPADSEGGLAAAGSPGTLATTSAPSYSGEWSSDTSIPLSSGLPSSESAVVVSIGGSAGVDASVIGLLKLGGFDVLPLGGSIEEMKQFKGLGAMYLDTHGAAFREVNSVTLGPNGDAVGLGLGDLVYSLETTTVVGTSELSQYKTELENNEIVISMGDTYLGLGEKKAKLAITESFISRYWSFEGGLVMLHSCFSGSGPFIPGASCFGACALSSGDQVYDPTPLRQAILDVGADAVVAFDNYVWPGSSANTINYVFDRTLGTNTIPPFISPKRRPFDLGKTADELVTLGIAPFEGPRSIVNVTFDTPGSLDHVTLNPTIQDLLVEDDAAKAFGEMTLFGTFGSDLGIVEVAGRSLAVTSWDANVIEAQVPFQGEGHVGEVIVKSPGGALKSNEVPLTEWTGGVSVTYSPGKGSLQAKGEVEARFRADLHAFRERPEEEPQEPIRVPYFSPASQGIVTGSGTFVDDKGSITFTGVEDFGVMTKAQVDAGGAPPVEGPSLVGGYVTLEPQANRAELCLSILGNVTVETVAGGQTQTIRSPLVFLPPDIFDSTNVFIGCLELSMSDTYVIPAGMREYKDGDLSIKLEWTSFTPESAPTADTKG